MPPSRIISTYRPTRAFPIILGLLLAATPPACDRTTRPATAPAASRPAESRPRPAIASLVPSATDLLLAMGAGDHLVAVSTYDANRAETRDLPRVGDYQSTDWEQVRALRPDVMVRQFAPQRVPPGLREQTRELGIELVNLRIDTLADIYEATHVLGVAAGEPAKAAALADRIRKQIDAVRQRTAGLPKPSVLLVRDAAGEEVVGPDTFLDELLNAAGGTNAVAGLNQRYPSIDREMLRKLDPDVIVQLLPDAAPQVLARAQRTWQDQPDLKAVRGGRVYTLTDWYVIQLGAHVGDLAERLAAALHPPAGEAGL